MFPRFSTDNIKNTCCVALVNQRNLFQEQPISAELANFAYLIIRKLRTSICSTRARHFFRMQAGRRAIPLCRSAFLMAIRNVISVCSQEHMRGIYTMANITCMQYMKIWWNCAMGDFIRDAMGKFKPVIDRDVSIATRVFTCRPQPARAGTIDLRPEAGNVVRGILEGHVKPPFDVSRRRVLEHCDGILMP